MITDLSTEQGVTDYMAQARTETDWNARCDDVKRANNGYPLFWYRAIVLSGLAHKTAVNWGGNADITLRSY